MTTDREFIKEILRAKTNQRVYTNLDIRILFRDIGVKLSEIGIRESLRESEISPAQYKINSPRFGYNRRVKFYPEEAVWQYLKKLENEGKVDLEAVGVHNFEDLLSRRNTLRDHYIKGRIIRKPLLED